MPPFSLTPKPPSLLRVPESQAISNSSSFISSASSSLFDRLSGASSGCLTDFSSPSTPSTAEFGCKEGASEVERSDSPTCLSSPQILLDRACALGTRSSVRSLEDFDAIAILRNRLERGNPTVLARRALTLMDSGVHSVAAGVRSSLETPVIEQLSAADGDIDEDWLDALEIAVAHSSIIFSSTSNPSLLDEQDIASSSSCSFELPSKPVLVPVTSVSPCSPFILGTPELSFNWQGSMGSMSSLSTVMEESPSSSVSSPVNISVDEEELARIMHTVISIPTRSRQPFTGSPQGDVDVATVMRLEIASTISADHPHLRTSQPRTLIGLGVAMPVIYPPLPPALFPYHHSPGATLNSRSFRELGYPFDDNMFGIEKTSLALPSRSVNVPSVDENVAGWSDLNFDESFHYSPLGGCTVPRPVLPEVGFGFRSSDGLRVEQPLPLAHTSSNYTSPFVFGKALVGLGLGLGLGDLTEASVVSLPLPAEPSPTIGKHHLVSADESVTETEVALPPVSEFYLQAQNSLKFEPLGVHKTIELDASQLERQSALYNLEHSDLQLDHIFSHSPPIRLEKRTEIERQLLADLFKKQSPTSPSSFESQFHTSPSSTPPLSIKQGPDVCTVTTDNFVEVEQPRSVNHPAVSNKRRKFVKKSYQTLKKLGLERLAIFHPRSGRDDLDLISPAVASQDDPRSPPPPPTSDVGFKSIKNVQIGLGLPSHVISRRLRMRGASLQESIDAVQSIGSSEECQNPSLMVTQPSMVSFSRVLSVKVSNEFLKPSHFPARPLYDIVEVPTPPSSTSSFSPRGTPSPRNQWSSPFVPLNPPRKKRSSRSQSSTPSTDSPSSIHWTEPEVGTSDVVLSPAEVVASPEVSVTPAASVRPGFKRFVSKFTRGLFKRSRLLKMSDDRVSSSSSPVLIVHLEAPTGLGLLQADHGALLCDTKENGFTSSISVHNLQLLF